MSENDEVVTFGGDQGRGQASVGQVHSEQVQPEESGRSESTNTVTQSVLTKEEAKSIFNNMKKEILDTTENWMRSQFDKRDTRLEKSIKEIQERAGNLGLDLDDPAVRDAITNIKRKVLNEEFDIQDKNERRSAQADDQVHPLAEYVATRQQQISDSVGTIVTNDDPEANSIDQSSMESFLTSYRAAAEAKKARLAQTVQPNKAPAAARMPGLGQGAPSKEDWQQKYKKEIEGKSNLQKLEIRRRYRDEGYPI